MKDKICFVVVQYGLEVNGGAEVHCRLLAERFTDMYDVEVLTTKFINYNTFETFYQEDVSTLNKVTVRRFESITYDKEAYHNAWTSAVKGRKVRRNLHRLKLLRFLSFFTPKWNLGIKEEEEMLKKHGSYSPQLLQFLKDHSTDYKAIICMSYAYPNTLYAAQIAPEKTILIPTVHNEREVFRSIQTHLFTSVKHIGFNTEEEQKLTKSIFGDRLSTNSIAAVGIEITPPISREKLFEKFDLPETYMLYFGRVCNTKIRVMLPWFVRYKEKYNNNLKLVLTGRLFMSKVDHPDIIYTDFVTEEEKTALITHAKFVINPSEYESLSLLLLETMTLGKPLLVNGKSDVMRAHCVKSDYAAQYYISERDFQQKINTLLKEDVKTSEEKAKKYVEENYNWDLIKARFSKIISSL